MSQPLRPLRRHVEELHAAWAGGLPALVPSAGDAQAEVEQMSDAALVRVGDLLARVRRDVDALLVRVAAEVSRRSGPEFGDTGLAKVQGFHNASRLIAASTGGSRHEAARLIAVGRATAQRQSFGGERLSARHPHAAAALEQGEIGLEAASAITAMLDRVAVRADPTRADRVGRRSSGSHPGHRSTCSCAACARPRPDWMRTASNRAKRSCVRSARSRCAKTSTGCCTSTRDSTPSTLPP